MADQYHPLSLQPGTYRPVYLWGGESTIRMNGLKFPGYLINDDAHLQAHNPDGVNTITKDMLCNWVHLMFDWGFPPEIESADWEEFAEATQHYHQAGAKVYAYIQTSNYVDLGSFHHQNWYAVNKSGRKINYFTFKGRLMACLNHPAWVEHLKELIEKALSLGADGIFFDNLFDGEQPLSMLGTWLGEIGCYCERCKHKYQADTGNTIPGNLYQVDEQVINYLDWRASKVTSLLETLSNYARKIKTDVVIAANDFDPILRNSYLVYGIDLAKLAYPQDVTMIENFALPKIQKRGDRLYFQNNALTIRNARYLVKNNAHLSSISYDIGIGYDKVYSERVYLQNISENAALGISTTIKGTEYFDGESMTLLLEKKYVNVHNHIGHINHWLRENHFIYKSQINMAPIGIVAPEYWLYKEWHKYAGPYFAMCQTLTANNIPWQVVSQKQVPPTIKLLLSATPQITTISNDIKTINISEIPGWNQLFYHRKTLPKWILDALTAFYKSLFSAYTNILWLRHIIDKLKLPRIFTQSSFYYLPSQELQQQLITTISPFLAASPQVQAKHPTLVEWYRTEKNHYLHLVNYWDEPQNIKIVFPFPIKYEVRTPDNKYITRGKNTSIIESLPLNIYSVIIFSEVTL